VTPNEVMKALIEDTSDQLEMYHLARLAHQESMERLDRRASILMWLGIVQIVPIVIHLTSQITHQQ
jgi:hypothetical protein